MDRGELVRKAIQEAHERQKSTVSKIGNSTFEFYKKGTAVWCRSTTGQLVNDYRVYKVNTDHPYIRSVGMYFELGEQEKQCVANLLNQSHV